MRCVSCTKISYELGAIFCTECGTRLSTLSNTNRRDTSNVVTEDTSLTQVMILSGIINSNSASCAPSTSAYRSYDRSDSTDSYSSSSDSYSSSSSDSSSSSSSSDGGGGGGGSD